VDEVRLFRGFGLRPEQRQEFTDVYEKLAIEDRPSLSPFFDAHWYLDTYRDVRAAGLDPFRHFCRAGVYELRSPHPLVWPSFIFEGQPELPGDIDLLARLREMLEHNLRAPSPYFELDEYLRRCPAAATHPGGALRHFLEAPIAEIAIPNRYFDAKWYRDRYPDVPQDPRAAFLHFASRGDRQKRFPGPGFDPEFYLWNNPDVRRAAVAPLQHFLQSGEKEGRRRGHGVAGIRAQAGPIRLTGPALADIGEGRDRYRKLRSRLADRRRGRSEAFAMREARPVVVRDLEAALRRLRFKACKRPRLSILVPFYDELKVTVECLTSVMLSGTRSTFEVVAADDCSPDPQVRRLAAVPGLVYHRQESNRNFLRNCNDVFSRLRGEYVLLLNNDAQVCPGALDRLVEALDGDPRIGAVGPCILFPDGRLQEAGCAVNGDCSATMVGLWADPAEPSFSYARDVQYVSGAALMFRRALVRETLFDPALAPAYCEDLDLCLGIREQGFAIRYVPEAQVVHHLSVSMSDQQRKLRRIYRNQQKLCEKWGRRVDEMNRVRVISFYLPQFHPTEENDLWWGAGFTEWANVSKAEPSYEGHYQPHLPADLGFYDLRVPDVLARQGRLAERYGLAGFCLYYYNFGGRPILDAPLRSLLSHPEVPFRFCLCWANENWSRRWDGGSNDLLMEQSYEDTTMQALAQDVGRAAQDPRYIRVDGKPLFLVYRPLLIPRPAEAVGRLRDLLRAAGAGEVHLVFVESMESLGSGVNPLDLGFDAAVEFPPQGVGVGATDRREIYKQDWDGRRYDYEQTVVNAILRPGAAYPRHPAIFPSWDNTPRQRLRGTSFDQCSPEVFQAYAEEKLEECKRLFTGEQRLLFVNAWNEWAEGAHLEPDQAYGHRWLEALQQALLRTGCC